VAPHPEGRLQRAEGAFRVTFLGGLHWPPNAAGILWFARHVWPLVAEHEPAARLTVIGKSPPAELLALRDRWQQQNHPSIDVLGYVDDPVPLLAESAVFVVPLHAGGGMRIKILDAWSWGVPVVSTSIGAEGIAVQDGVNLCLADTPPEFAGAIRYLLRNPAAGRELADAAFETLQTAYDWRVVYPAWDDVYRRARSSIPATTPLTPLAT
jgi:glycosyltransferase involved in cell wall biosynthesis